MMPKAGLLARSPVCRPSRFIAETVAEVQTVFLSGLLTAAGQLRVCTGFPFNPGNQQVTGTNDSDKIKHFCCIHAGLSKEDTFSSCENVHTYMPLLRIRNPLGVYFRFRSIQIFRLVRYRPVVLPACSGLKCALHQAIFKMAYL